MSKQRPARPEATLTLAQCYQYYFDHSGKASDVARQLALGAIAIVWVFKPDQSGIAAFPVALKWAALLAAFTLAFDLLQYVFATVAWGGFSRYQENRNRSENILAPRFINWPALFCFGAKLALLVAAYVAIAKFLVQDSELF